MFFFLTFEKFMFIIHIMKKTRSSLPYQPIYQKLFEHYKKLIISQSLKPGDQIDSINQMIEKFQIARETAKKVLNLLAKEGLIIKKAGKGSFIVEQKKVKKSWGIILPFYSLQYEELLHEISFHAQKMERKLEYFIDYNFYQEEISLVEKLIHEQYEVIIIIPTLDESKTAQFYSKLSYQNSLILLLDHTMTGSFFPYVIQSYDLGIKRAMAYLIEKSEGNIAFFRNRVASGRNLILELMEETYRDVISEHKIEPFFFDSIHEINLDIIQKNQLDGFLCSDDINAIKLIGFLKQNKLKPKLDYHLVSYGNTDLAKFFTPGITAINSSYGEMAKILINMIKDGQKGKELKNAQYVIQPKLIERET